MGINGLSWLLVVGTCTVFAVIGYRSDEDRPSLAAAFNWAAALPRSGSLSPGLRVVLRERDRDELTANSTWESLVHRLIGQFAY